MSESIPSSELTDAVRIEYFCNLFESGCHKAQMTTSLSDSDAIAMRGIEYALQYQEPPKNIVQLYKNGAEGFSQEIKSALETYLEEHPEL